METKSDKIIILDLDETLIHSTQTELHIPYHFKVDNYFVYKRPLLKRFLTDISRHFAIGVWSSASDAYVTEIVKQLIPNGVDLLVTWGRTKCTLKRDLVYDTWNYEKRLDKLKKKGFPIEKILIIDDTPAKSRTNYGNAVYIKEFTGDPNDKELQFLYEYLLTLKPADNVRTVEKRRWRQ